MLKRLLLNVALIVDDHHINTCELMLGADEGIDVFSAENLEPIAVSPLLMSSGHISPSLSAYDHLTDLVLHILYTLLYHCNYDLLVRHMI